MRCSVLLAVSFAIGAWAQTQPASQEEINRALELLRNTPVVAPPPTAKPGVPLKVTPTTTNTATPVAPAKPLVTPPPSSALTTDMERRARELLQGTQMEPRTQTSPPSKEVLERANARDELRKQAVQETRRGLPQDTNTSAPATLAQEQQRKAQEEIDRQKNIERIEMEVQRARLARQQKAAAQAEGANANPPTPAVTAAPPAAAVPAPATPTNAPAVAVTTQTTPATRPETAAGITPDQEAKARALLNELLAQPGRTNAPLAVPKTHAPSPAPAPVAPPAQVASPAPVKPAPVVPAQPVPPPQEPKPVVVQQTPPPAAVTPAVTPAPVPASTPAPVTTVQQPRPTTVPSFKGLAPDMEQRARDILQQVMENTKDASMPALATQPPKPATVTPAPESQAAPQPQAVAPAPPPVRGPEAPVAPVVTAPSIRPASTPTPNTEGFPTLAPDQEAKARELLNQTLATVPAPTTPTPTPATTVETKATPDLDRRAQEDARRQAKLKAEIEEQTRREIARMEEESQARAREMAKRRLEEEKRAQKKPQASEVAATPAAKPVVAATVTHTPAPAQPKPSAPTPTEKPEKPRKSKSEDKKAPAAAPAKEVWKDASRSREQRLTDLLEAYAKDQISAQQYHTERAKILSSPQ